MKSNAELNRIAVAASQATAKIFLGPNAVQAVNYAVMGKDAQLDGIFSTIGTFFKNTFSKIGGKRKDGKSGIVARKEPGKFAGWMSSGGGEMVAGVLEQLVLNKTENLPVPPVDINSPQYLSWAMNAARSTTQLSPAEERLLQDKIRIIQFDSARQVPQGTSYYPMPQVPMPVQQAMQQEKFLNMNTETVLMVGGAVAVLALALARKQS